LVKSFLHLKSLLFIEISHYLTESWTIMTLLLLWWSKGIMYGLIFATFILFRIHIRINLQFMIILLGHFHHFLKWS